MSEQIDSTKPNATARVGEIDLLRFCAAFMVVLFHYAFRGYAADGYSTMPYPLLAGAAKYGYLGVDLFFLISGFVILMTASSGSLKKFFISRVIRLYPAFWVCCTLTFLAILILDNGRFTTSTSRYLVNMTMLNEFMNIRSVDGVYWSLAVEIKFYVMVALLLLFRQIKRAQMFLGLWLAATIMLDIFPEDHLRSMFVTGYSPYFIAGAIGFLIYSSGISMVRLTLFSTSWLVALRHAMMSIPASSSRYHEYFDPIIVGGLMTFFFALILLVATKKTSALAKINWTNLGALTYPLYLVHQVFGYLIFNKLYPLVNPHLLFSGTILLMILIAYFVHSQVEQRYSRRLKTLLEKALTELRPSAKPI